MKILYLLPTGKGAGSVSLPFGLQYALERKGFKVAKFHPFKETNLTDAKLDEVFLDKEQDDTIENILFKIDRFKSNNDFLIVSGICPNQGYGGYIEDFNAALIKALNAYVILILKHGSKSIDQIEEQIKLYLHEYNNTKIIGAIITKLNAPTYPNGVQKLSLINSNLAPLIHSLTKVELQAMKIFTQDFKLLGVTVWSEALTYPKMSDLAEIIGLNIVSAGDMKIRRVRSIVICDSSIRHIIPNLKPGTLIITSSDRSDVLISSALLSSQGMKLAGIVLTGGYSISRPVKDLCTKTTNIGLPIFYYNDSSIALALKLSNINFNIIPPTDFERIQQLSEDVAEHIDTTPLEHLASDIQTRLFSPAAFKYMLIKKAQQLNKLILLPEGTEPRTIKAANICAKQNIATCILMGGKDEILKVTSNYGISLNEKVKILEPQNIRKNYLELLLKLRKNKYLNPQLAQENLEDNVMLATLMLYQKEADGLVSGAVHSTANTIRPPLQIIKTKPDASLVSSVFFMCMENQVLVFGDCAVNPKPTAEELADIAIQSVASAKSFSIEPKVAMISYSTGSSGSGADVDKIRQATEIVKTKRPDIIIDGPLQYDAAVTESVAKKKAPNSPVAGQATVLIFPDLNTGNTTYKAIQRSANVLSIGPILQGMNKPVNDLSRGATIDDIVYTIAITAIQASQIS